MDARKCELYIVNEARPETVSNDSLILYSVPDNIHIANSIQQIIISPMKVGEVVVVTTKSRVICQGTGKRAKSRLIGRFCVVIYMCFSTPHDVYPLMIGNIFPGKTMINGFLGRMGYGSTILPRAVFLIT